MLDLTSLKQAFEPLSQVGRDEKTFDVEGTTLTIRPLLPMEEVQVQRFSASVLDEIQNQEGLGNQDQMSRAAAMDYFDRFRIEVIAYSIVQVNDTDLRKVERVPTGEVLENGTPVQVPRTIAMRGIVQTWSRAMITVCFAKYGDLVQKIADEADKIVTQSLADLDAEIERTENRLKELKEDRETRAKGDPSVTAMQITQLVQAGAEMQEDVRRAAAKAEAEKMAAQATEPTPPPQRKSVIPDEAPPPSPAVVREEAGFPPPAAPAAPLEDLRSSFEDGEDAEVMAAEEARILEAQKRARTASRQKMAPQDAGQAVVPQPPPAPETSRDSLSRAQSVGSVEGVEAYRLPAEEMSPRGRKNSASKKQAAPDRDATLNPNFKSNS